MCDIIPKKIYMYLNKVHVYDTAVTAFYDLFMIRSVNQSIKVEIYSGSTKLIVPK